MSWHNSVTNSQQQSIIEDILQEISNQSAHHRKHKNLMVQYLMDEFGYEKDLAWMVVQLHFCTSMAEVMNVFILGDQDKYQHYFIPQTLTLSFKSEQQFEEEYFDFQHKYKHEQNEKKQSKCRVCGQGPQYHIKFIQQTKSKPILEKYFQKYCNQSKIFESHRSSIIKDKQQSVNDDIKHSMDPLISKKYSYESKNKQQKIMPVLSQSKKQTVLCQICYTTHDRQEIFSINGVSHEICIFCMDEYIKEEILNRRVENIRCPHCGQTLTSQTIKGIVSNTIYQKFQTFLRYAQIQNDPNLRWCPNPKCSVVLNFEKSKKKIKCPKCLMQICTKCNNQYHPKQTCDQVFDSQLKGLQNAKDIQKCRKCKALVEKVSGCNHMTCTVCRYEWCWLCGSTYSYVHYSPLNPLGCAGLQNRHHSSWGKCRIFMLRFFIMLGLIIAVPIAIPLIMLFCGPGILIALMSDSCRRKGCCFKFLLSIFLIPIGFVIDPFVWIWAVFYFTPRICSDICQWFARRREIHNYSENQLKRRLIQEGQIIAT